MGLTAIYCPYVLGIHKKALLGRDTSTPIWLVNKFRKSFGRGDTAIQRLINTLTIFFKWAIHGLFFFYFSRFYKQQICSIKVADVWIRIRVLWYRKRPLCQLRHNHFPTLKQSCKKTTIGHKVPIALNTLMPTLLTFFKWANPGLFLFIFDLFKQTLQFFQQICVKKCPSSIWCRDSNPQPSERESLPTGSFPVLVIDEH